MGLGENIQTYRKQIDLTQEELAERCQISRQAVTKWESGESTPGLEKIVQLADIFDISVDMLIGRNEKDPIMKLKEIIKELEVVDIPDDDDDEIDSSMLYRFIEFMKLKGADSGDTLEGLKAIFLK